MGKKKKLGDEEFLRKVFKTVGPVEFTAASEKRIKRRVTAAINKKYGKRPKKK